MPDPEDTPTDGSASQDERRKELDQAITRLAALSPLEYQPCREAEAKRLGIRLGSLDDEVRKRRRVSDRGDDAPLVPEPELWPGEVDGVQLLDALAAEITRYIVLPPGAADVIALWVTHTYCLGAASVTPRLFITSPDKGCGKTTLLTLLGRFCCKAMPASNITPAVIFRIIEECQPTLLIDEADTVFRDNEQLRGVLNSGHSRSMARVIRCEGDDHKPRVFSTWTPVAFASIGGQHGTLTDRSIIIRMKRKLNSEHVEQLRENTNREYHKELAAKAATWGMRNLYQLQGRQPAMPPHLQNRAADNWEPLLAIADLAGGDWPRRARDAALLLGKDAVEDETTGIELLADIRSIFDAERCDKIGSNKLCDRLAGMEDTPWNEVNRGHKITPWLLAQLLEGFGIRPGTKRQGARTFKGYVRANFADAWARYLPPVSTVTPSHPGTINGLDENDAVTSSVTEERLNVTPSHDRRDDVPEHPTGVTASVTGQTSPNPLRTNGCSGVTAQIRPSRQQLDDLLNTPMEHVFRNGQWVIPEKLEPLGQAPPVEATTLRRAEGDDVRAGGSEWTRKI